MASAQKTKAQVEAQDIQRILNYYYPSPPVPLNSVNSFTFLIAVVLSAQTTDGKVNEVTKELFCYADSPEKMSKLEPSFVQSIIQPVGLAPRKAEYLVNLSRCLVQHHNGQVPNSFDALEKLPGVGHKTASVIMSQVFNIPAFAVDTHVHRLAIRWGISKEEKSVDKAQRDLCAFFDKALWNKLHLQMIYFGREFCTAKDHQALTCPMCAWVATPCSNRDINGHVEQLKKFVPKKKAKGIVYYSDRVQQLTVNPSLASNSPSKNVSDGEHPSGFEEHAKIVDMAPTKRMVRKQDEMIQSQSLTKRRRSERIKQQG